jgi:hypothetical protein
MATIVTAVSTLLRAFNVPRSTPVYKDKNPYESKIPEGPAQDPGFYLGSLGNPVVADITLVGGSYFSDEMGRVVTYNDIVLETVLITLGRPKRIIKTDITGRDGTVKEYINMDDFQVTINGVITGPNGVYPTLEVMALHDICEAPVSIPVVSWYLQNFKIFNLVIDNYAMDQEPGGISKQNFTLNCVSDRPVELIIVR